MNLKEWIRKKVLKTVGLAKTDSLEAEADRLTFINDEEKLTRQRIREYNIWYGGDGDELLNFYTHQNTLEYNFEPWYSRNKREYFWAISSTEKGIKRTHSGQPRNIVDTLVNIIKFPVIDCAETESADGKFNRLTQIINDCNLKKIYKNKQLPLTLVEGWGCFKINWDKSLSDYPYPIYYRAEQVDFIEKSNRIIGIIFKDYYTDGDKKQMLMIETRTIKYDEATKKRYLDIEKQLFRANESNEFVDPIEQPWNELVPELKDAYENRHVRVDDCTLLLAVPCIIFENTARVGGPGRSIFTGKIDLFDDLDQCLSQNSNAVRKSTPVEYFNSDFLERDPETGIPIQPKAYDRKYSIYSGQRDANGGSTVNEPVQVTQPNLDFEQYSTNAVQILLQIVNGVMSPATLGIDIAKKDNAEAQREKEKVTIFTRNAIIEAEEIIYKDLCNQLLCSYELMHEGIITKKDYDISVKFSEFADDSYENKLEKLGQAFDNQLISEEMFMKKLYDNTLTKEEFEKEINWLKENHTKPQVEGQKGAAAGAMMGGMNPEAMSEMEGMEEEEL